MDLMIWPPIPSSPQVFLRLVHRPGGGIELRGVNEAGDRFHGCSILEITAGGVLRLVAGCKVPGIKTNSNELIIIRCDGD